MTRQEFEKKFETVIKQHVTQIVEGQMSSKEDREKANFNGVYVLLENDEVIYIGSAYPSSFPVSKRLYIHYNAHTSNSCLAKHFLEETGCSRESAKERIGKLKFIAMEYFPLEYYLIENTPGLKNSKGYKPHV